MIIDGLSRFCLSADDMPVPMHISVDGKIDQSAADWRRQGLRPYVAGLWGESIDARGNSAVIPDVCLKVEMQSNPRIESDCMLVGEAQDTCVTTLYQRTNAECPPTKGRRPEPVSFQGEAH